MQLRSELRSHAATMDCCLVIEDGSVHVHLALLCQVWPELKSLIANEDQSCHCERKLIIIPGLKKSTALNFLEILYTGNCCARGEEEVKDLLDLSITLGLVWNLDQYDDRKRKKLKKKKIKAKPIHLQPLHPRDPRSQHLSREFQSSSSEVPALWVQFHAGSPQQQGRHHLGDRSSGQGQVDSHQQQGRQDSPQHQGRHHQGDDHHGQSQTVSPHQQERRQQGKTLHHQGDDHHGQSQTDSPQQQGRHQLGKTDKHQQQGRHHQGDDHHGQSQTDSPHSSQQRGRHQADSSEGLGRGCQGDQHHAQDGAGTMRFPHQVEHPQVQKDNIKSADSSSDSVALENINKFSCEVSKYSLPTVLFTNKCETKVVEEVGDNATVTVCSRNCQENCGESVRFWSLVEKEKIKSHFTGLSLANKQQNLFKQLTFQMSAGLSTEGFFYNKQLLCVKQFSELASISCYILRKLLRNFSTGHKMYLHGNSFAVKTPVSCVNFCAWMKLFSQKYGQDGPDQIVTILPSFLNKSELFKIYLEESPAPHLKRSSFYKAFKSNFGPRRRDFSLPWIRISKESSHSKCDTCLGLDQFLRKSASDAEAEYARGLKEQHVEIFSGSRIAVKEFIQRSINDPKQVIAMQVDSMDNAKSMLPRILERSKQLSGMFRLPAKITGCITTSSMYAEGSKVQFFINHGEHIYCIKIYYRRRAQFDVASI